MLKTIAASALALTLMTGSAFALTISNKGSEDAKVGVDFGNKEKVVPVPAGKSVKVDGCQDGCGLSGPWNYSWLTRGDNTFAFSGDKIILSNT